VDGMATISSSHPAIEGQPETPASLRHSARAVSKNDHHRNPRLWKASVQFEAIFLEQLLASMKKTIPDSGLLKKGFAEDTQSGMFNQAVAESIAQRSRTGIAITLYRQLEKDFPQTAPMHDSVQAGMNPSDTEIRKQAMTGGADARN